LADLIKNLDRSELTAGIYLMQGRIAAQFISLEFNFSTKLLVRSISDRKDIKRDLTEELALAGDIGLLLEKIVDNKGKTLTLEEVYKSLVKIATLSGKDSQSQKMVLFREMIDKMSPLEAKFCARIVVGKLRL